MDCLVIYRVGDHGREGLCDPEGVPYENAASQKGQQVSSFVFVFFFFFVGFVFFLTAFFFFFF